MLAGHRLSRAAVDLQQPLNRSTPPFTAALGNPGEMKDAAAKLGVPPSLPPSLALLCMFWIDVCWQNAEFASAAHAEVELVFRSVTRGVSDAKVSNANTRQTTRKIGIFGRIFPIPGGDLCRIDIIPCRAITSPSAECPLPTLGWHFCFVFYPAHF